MIYIVLEKRPFPPSTFIHNYLAAFTNYKRALLFARGLLPYNAYQIVICCQNPNETYDNEFIEITKDTIK